MENVDFEQGAIEPGDQHDGADQRQCARIEQRPGPDRTEWLVEPRRTGFLLGDRAVGDEV